MNTAAEIRTAWARASAAGDVSKALDSLVPRVCEEIQRRPSELRALREGLEALLAFLASPSGRTDANCQAVDTFFCVPDVHGWNGEWGHLPQAFREILADIGGMLHDTVSAPEIARNFDSTPEQLLDRVRNIEL